MVASYPAAQKTFSDIVDGTDYVEADQMNQAYDEIEAMQIFLGTLGAGNTQGFSATLLAALANYRRGAEITFKDVDEVTVAAGAIVFEASGKYRMRLNTTSTDVGWADIDTGAEADTTYYVYAVADAEATTFTFLISTNAATPTGATYYKRLGSFVNSTDIISALDDVNVGNIKGWANFNGTTFAQVDDYNVTSITDNGTGDYTITWATDFMSTGYAISGVASGGLFFELPGGGLAAGTARVNTRGHAGSLIDSAIVTAMAIGGQ